MTWRTEIQNNCKVIVVDDSSLFRSILTKALSSLENVEVVSSAPNGKLALEKIAQFKPDLVTLDLEMPEMDGIETLRQIKARGLDTGVVMVSAHTVHGAEITMKALNNGAFDFITKPSDNDPEKNLKQLAERMKYIIRAFQSRKSLENVRRMTGRSVETAPPETKETSKPSSKYSLAQIEIVTLGISTGGPKALDAVIPRLPENLPVPVVIVQHMPAMFTKAFAEMLNGKSKVTVVEGAGGMEVKPATVYIAPGGCQMKLEREATGRIRVDITDDPPENNCKPAVDYLFRSVAKLYGSGALGVIMTGMGNDGTLGLRLMKRHNARVIAQDEKTSTVFGMPAEAIKAGVVDRILPLDKIAEEIIRISFIRK